MLAALNNGPGASTPTSQLHTHRGHMKISTAQAYGRKKKHAHTQTQHSAKLPIKPHLLRQRGAHRPSDPWFERLSYGFGYGAR